MKLDGNLKLDIFCRFGDIHLTIDSSFDSTKRGSTLATCILPYKQSQRGVGGICQ